MILIVSGALNVGYFFPIVHRAYFHRGTGLSGHGEASPFMVVPIVITALLSVLLGIFPNLFFGLFDIAGVVSASIFEGVAR
jgi:multicomponent Na+:H+ antiporter subunit D